MDERACSRDNSALEGNNEITCTLATNAGIHFTPNEPPLRQLLQQYSIIVSLEEDLGGWEFGPPVDIYEDGQELTFKVEVPGIDEKDIKVEVESNVLTLHGERKLEKDLKRKTIAAWNGIMAPSRGRSHCQTP